jgi:hypothetical protein
VAPKPAKAVEVFYSYSHKDEELRDDLEKHLSILKRQGVITGWHDRRIGAGREWEGEIDRHLNTAGVILLLISADFLASDYSYDVELKRAMERHETGEARVIPVILRAVDWKGAPFGVLQALPKDGEPVTSWPNRDEAFADVGRGVRLAVEGLESSSAPGRLPGRRETGGLRTLELAVEHGDITSLDADVVALKYARKFHGVDRIVAAQLRTVGIATERLRPRVGAYRYVDTRGGVRPQHALFVGVAYLNQFGYPEIREFSRRVLDILADEAPTSRHVAMTIHGPGYGLDEAEALLAQIRGYLDAIQSERLPAMLDRISIVDINRDRVRRLRLGLERYLVDPGYADRVESASGYSVALRPEMPRRGHAGAVDPAGASEVLGRESEAKSHVAVAMSFGKDMDDVFYYGIQRPVRDLGFLCERIDQESFTGDILDEVMKRIETAAVVIAELSGASPNVYLEVGYSWGKERPTILLVKDTQELHFDVRGQRCLTYERIKDLEESLAKELTGLRSKGLI